MAKAGSTAKTGFDITVLLLFTGLVLQPVLFLISTYYEDAIKVVFANSSKEYVDSLLSNQTLKSGFKIFKIVLFPILIWLVSLWLDYFTLQKKRFTSFLVNTVSTTLYNSFPNNTRFLRSLDKNIRVSFLLILSAFFIGLCYLMVSVPLGYDELFSYSIFSGKGIWTSVSYYPVPNNHVLYNSVTSFFVQLPGSIELLIRIPALLATMVTVWYFFKLCYRQFGGTVAVISVGFIMCIYPFQLFSFSARGYAFVNLCCVLILYAVVKLKEDPFSKKYRSLFVLTGFLGMLSVPSFLYVLLPVYSVRFIYVLIQEQKKGLFNFVKECIITGLLVFIGYSFILLLNSPQKLVNPNGGVTKFSLTSPGLSAIITGHLKDVSNYLFFNPYSLVCLCGITLACLVYRAIIKKDRDLFLILFSFFMLISPPFILLLHRLLPFERTWLYLIFPAAVCIGFIITELKSFLIRHIPVMKEAGLGQKFIFIVTGTLIFSQAKFKSNHEFNAKIDYEIAEIRKIGLDRELQNIHSISMTNAGFEFYPAEYIKFLCNEKYPDTAISLTPLDSITNQDILIIHNSEEDRFKGQLSNYRGLKCFDEKFCIFYKNKP